MAALNSSLYTSQLAGKSALLSGSLTKGSLIGIHATIAVPSSGAGTALNDTLGLFMVPKGAILKEFILDFDQLESNSSPTLTLDVGDAALATRIMSAGVAGKLAGTLRQLPSALGYQFLADTAIFATIHAAASTKAAGNLAASLKYTMGGLAS